MGDRREVDRSDVLENLTRNFSRQPEKEAALDLIYRTVSLNRVTVSNVQLSLQRLEALGTKGLVATSLAERLARRRIMQILDERMLGVAGYFRRYGKTIAEVALASAIVAERIAAIARHRAGKFPDASVYWRKIAKSAPPRSEQSEAKNYRNAVVRGNEVQKFLKALHLLANSKYLFLIIKS